MEIGVCKECLSNVPLNKETQLVGELEEDFLVVELGNAVIPADKGVVYDVWECPNCFYPNNRGDFWEIFDED